MKKLYYLFMFVLIFNSCQYGITPATVSINIDPISNKQILTTSAVRLQNTATDPMGNPNFYIFGIKIDTSRAINFEIGWLNNSPGTIDPGTPVILKYNDASLDTIYAIDWGHPDVTSYSLSVTMWNVKFNCYLPERVLKTIQTKQVIYVRVAGDKYIDREVKPEFGNAFREVTALLQ